MGDAPTHLTEVRPASPALSLERRAGLARETLRLIRSLADSLARDAEQARRQCAIAGDPDPVAEELDALVDLSRAMRRQGDQLIRAFAVLDRLVPPGPPGHGRNGAAEPRRAPRAAAPWITEEGSDAELPAAGPPEPLSPEDESRAAAAAFAVALKLDGASPEQVAERLRREFGRPDAAEIAAEAFGP